MILSWLKKDFKLLPVLVLACTLLPCLFCWLLGNLYAENVPFGVVDLDNSALSRQIVHGLQDHPGLEVTFVADQQTLEADITANRYYGGMIIPENFSKSLSNRQPKELVTIVDATNTLIANNIMAYVASVTGTYSAGAMLTLLEAKGMPATAAMHTFNTFQFVDRTLYDPYLSYLSYLLYFLMPYLVQMILVCLFGLPLFSELRQEIILHGRSVLTGKRLAEITVRFLFLTLLAAINSWLGYCLADYFFGLPVRGVLGLYLILFLAFAIALMGASLMLSLLCKPQHCSYFFEAYLTLGMVILLTSGAVWLPYLMPKGLFQIVGVIWPFAHIALPFKLLNLKGSGWDVVAPAIVDCLQYTAFWLVIVCLITWLQRRWYRAKQAKTPKHDEP